MDKNAKAAIEATLSNDEASTDEQVLDYLQREFGLSEAEAKDWVSRRDQYLKQLNFGS